MRLLFALQGLHRYNRGAETALVSLATELARTGDDVTLLGSGYQRPHTPYRFIHCGSVPREKFEAFPTLPVFRNEFVYEEATFAFNLLRCYRPADYDVTITCSYPFINWVLRRPGPRRKRPAHVFITENGDWAAYARNSEYRFFGCEGLVCTNPDFYARNKDRWRSRLIPNGIDCERFGQAKSARKEFGLPQDRLIILMVSALVPTKRVDIGIEAVTLVRDAHLVIAGDGPLRQSIDARAAELLPGRFTRLTVAAEQMPALYHSADVFLHLSKEESFGNVFLEAMASGLPIVAHDSPRTRWIVGDSEFLLDTDYPDKIALDLELAGQDDPARRGTRILRAAEFSWLRLAEEYRTFFKEVLCSRNQTGLLL